MLTFIDTNGTERHVENLLRYLGPKEYGGLITLWLSDGSVVKCYSINGELFETKLPN